MNFHDTDARIVVAGDAVMQIYVTTCEGGSCNVSTETFRRIINEVYGREADFEDIGSKWEIVAPFLIFRRLGFTKEVMLDALTQLEAQGAIPTPEKIWTFPGRLIGRSKER